MKKPNPVTIPEILEYYMFHYVEKKCADYQRQRDACKSLLRAFAEMLPGDLTPDVVQSYETDRAGGAWGRFRVGSSTVRRELVVLISALNYAVDQLVLAPGSHPKIALPPSSPPKDLWLTQTELDDFLALAHNTNVLRYSRVFRMVAIVAETASRKTAVQELTWPQVDFDARLIRFDKDGKQKTKKRRVPVPISNRLMPILIRAFDERLPGCEYVLDTPYSIQHHFEDLRKLACEKLGDKFQKLTLHSLRHTAATLMAQAGVDLREIAGVLGDSQATVDKVYAHHCPEFLRAAINFRELTSSSHMGTYTE
jgi:integrase